MQNELITRPCRMPEIEPFVDADRVARFLSLTRREVLKLTRRGLITGYTMSGTARKTYKYRLSVVAEDMTTRAKPLHATMLTGSPRSSAAGKEIHG